MVETGGLENRLRGNSHGGSNPSSSASQFLQFTRTFLICASTHEPPPRSRHALNHRLANGGKRNQSDLSPFHVLFVIQALIASH